jgi:NAD(P)-dependent dehydrogenase (short-subunit alcohol dehydrogenase family)
LDDHEQLQQHHHPPRRSPGYWRKHVDPYDVKRGAYCSQLTTTRTGKGIGKATALAFAAAGVRGLVLASRTRSDLERAAEEAKQRSTNPDFETLVVVCDVSIEDDIINMVKSAVDKFGALDYAVNNAGVRPCHPRRSSTREEPKL